VSLGPKVISEWIGVDIETFAVRRLVKSKSRAREPLDEIGLKRMLYLETARINERHARTQFASDLRLELDLM
jgi:hypothetical protein